MNSPAAPLTEKSPRLSPLSWIVLGLWVATLLVICIRLAASPHRNNVFQTYETAGLHWSTAHRLYTRSGGFVYSPLTAAFFAGFNMLPGVSGRVVWRLLNVLVYAGAVWWWLRAQLHEAIPRFREAWVFLLLLPLSIGNLNNSQANPLLIGLLMIAIVGAHDGRWWLAAFCVAAATYFKLYPIVVGMLLVVIFPRQFAWRLAAAMLLLGGFTFLCQSPAYVLEQYQDWWGTRMHDNRHLYDLSLAPRDLWLLLHQMRLNVSETAYRLLQIAAGALIALYALLERRRASPLKPLLAHVFTLASCWMLLLGPATESATYVLLAPAVVLAFVSEWQLKSAWWLRVWLFAGLALLIAGLAVNSFTNVNRDSHARIIQPLAALLFSVYAVLRLSRRSASPALPDPESAYGPPLCGVAES